MTIPLSRYRAMLAPVACLALSAAAPPLQALEIAGAHAVRAVRGNVALADGAFAKGLAIVHGSIAAGEQVTISGDVRVLEGKASMQRGSHITGSLTAVYGDIELAGVRVDSDVQVFCSRLNIAGGEIAGEIKVERRWMARVKCDTPNELTVGPHAQIHSLVALDPHTRLRVHRTASIGQIHGVVPVYFD
jgi:hypothetical protein